MDHNIIDDILRPAHIEASAWSAEAFERELLRASRIFEVKAALLDLISAPTADARRPAAGAGRVQSHDPKLDDEPAIYGPAARRRLDNAWTISAPFVDGYLCYTTGYTLAELRSINDIERCMSLAAGAAGAHPALYPALMKLWRLQHDVEATL